MMVRIKPGPSEKPEKLDGTNTHPLSFIDSLGTLSDLGRLRESNCPHIP